ncbi:type 4a pilus biogenesis protein PilO [Terrilactibacillus sp. BCM23-1]|uniref:Type 4a pilus biogenesis protein PilO n=1 Tax=Terrilactibacillus tamarindi TaxID=2599694 RepID=A0A6N8CRR1_9BACI|nr:type 4a pilus biogenesis protein PilO [Terrilactibacillus tamarindi]MTT31753.1 type 4a pilus biogenesis protein PilO [Terrilactibacillus tamarindi]
MRQTMMVTIAAMCLILFGFVLFYLKFLIPMQDDLAYTKATIDHYQQLSKEKPSKQENHLSVNKALPSSPDVETFFVDVHRIASANQIGTLSIIKSDQESSSNVPDYVIRNTYTLTIQAKNKQNIKEFIHDVEKLKREFSINKLEISGWSAKNVQAICHLTLYSFKK